jgi:hypothetical protein
MIEHDDKPGPDNMIKRGQGISDRFDHESGVSIAARRRRAVAASHRAGPLLAGQRQ